MLLQENHKCTADVRFHRLMAKNVQCSHTVQVHPLQECIQASPRLPLFCYSGMAAKNKPPLQYHILFFHKEKASVPTLLSWTRPVTLAHMQDQCSVKVSSRYYRILLVRKQSFEFHTTTIETHLNVPYHRYTGTNAPSFSDFNVCEAEDEV